MDSNSNIMLNLTFFNGRGSIHGQVHGYNTSQAIQALLSANSSERSTLIIRLGEAVTCIPPKNHVRVALHPYGHKTAEISRMIPCLEDGLRKFRDVESSSQVPTQVLTQESQSGWAYWVNPLNWVADSGFSLTSSTSRIVILVLSCIVGMLTFACILKCCFCISNPCCCK